MENKYFAELARRLREDGINTGDGASGRLPVLLHGQVSMHVAESSDVFLMPEASGDQEAGDLYHQVSRLAAEVKEYTMAMERAPLLEGVDLDPADGFRLLADFNGVLLAGQELERGRGYQFVTWNWTHNRKGVGNGDYFMNGYEAAKKGFAVRSGLIAGERLFDDEQLTELYRCSDYFLEEGSEPTPEQMKALSSARKQIEEAVPDLQERLEQGQVQDPILDM